MEPNFSLPLQVTAGLCDSPNVLETSCQLPALLNFCALAIETIPLLQLHLVVHLSRLY